MTRSSLHASMKQAARYAFAGILLCGIVLFPANYTPGYGQVEFKSFESNRDRFEQYVDRAGDAEERAEWDRIVESGRDAMEAGWEREADLLLERTLQNEGAVDDEERRADLARDKMEAKAEWEADIEAAIAAERGKWYAQRQHIGIIELEGAFKSRLQSVLAEAETKETMEAFDQTLLPEKQGVDTDWEAELAGALARARDAATVLDPDERAAFEKEIEQMATEVRDRYSLERDNLLFTTRNRFYREHFVDDQSLRAQRENEDARGVTDDILQRTKDELKEEEARILNRDTSSEEGADSIDFSSLGDNWQEEIRLLMERGMAKWKAAQDELYSRMLDWKNNAEEAFKEADARWAKSYDSLLQARNQWLSDLENEIYTAMADWGEKGKDLASNIEAAKAEFGQYMGVVQEQWNTEKSRLAEMLIKGPMELATAKEQVEWLEENMELYEDQGYYNFTETLEGYGTDNWKYTDSVTTFNDNPYLEGLNINERFSDEVYDFRSYVFSLISDNGSKRFDTSRPFSMTVTPQLQNVAYDAENEQVIETYQVHMYAYMPHLKRGRKCAHKDAFGKCVWWKTVWNRSSLSRQRVFTFTNIVDPSEDTPTTRYFYYASNHNDWSHFYDQLNGTVEDGEGYLHNQLMLGEDDGPGYLRNAEGEYGLSYNEEGSLSEDMYLMTDEEEAYELARRDRDFWEDRLTIAEDVLKYARPDMYPDDNPYADQGMRESAWETRQRVDNTRTTKEDAYTAYQNHRASIQSILDNMAAVRTDIPDLQNAVIEAQETLDADRAVYQEEMNRLKNDLGDVDPEDEEAYNDLLNQMEAARQAYAPAQQAFDTAKAALDAAKAEYESYSSQYTEAMNTSAELYQVFKQAEFSYERAYAVWEYANSPYLKETFAQDTHLGEENLLSADGVSLADFDSMQAPDALENYQYVLSMYNNSETAFTQAKEAMENQDTVEDLNEDGDYGAEKTDLSDSTTQLISFLTNEENSAILAAYDKKSEEEKADDTEGAMLAAERESLQQAFSGALNEYMSYGENAMANGWHDPTILLREQEAALWSTLETVRDALGRTSTAYGEITGCLLGSSEHAGVTTMIVSGIMQQKQEFQDQSLNQQQQKFDLRQNRWFEVVSYIRNRGLRDWSNSLNDYQNRWRMWREEARAEIREGEDQFKTVAADLESARDRWQRQTAVAAGDAGTEKMQEEIGQKLDAYIARLTASLPEGVTFDIDPGAIVSRVKNEMPDGLGVLSDSMNTVDTTAAVEQMMNLGFNGDYYAVFDDKMKEYENKMEVMQTVRMGEMAYRSFQEMLSQFSNSLAEANANMHQTVINDMANADPYDGAPFKLHRRDNQWSVRYISKFTAIRKEKKTYYFDDFRDYVNTTVYLKPIKGISGEVDFGNPYTYQNIDTDELGIYISLEQAQLSREIDKIFSNDGYFNNHVSTEMERLGASFNKGYEKWQKGEAMSKGGPFNAPLATGLPSPRVIAQVGGSIACSLIGGPALSMAYNAAWNIGDMATGRTAWQHGVTQMGVGMAAGLTGPIGGQIVNLAAQGIEYEDDGSVNFSFDNYESDQVKRGMANIVVSSLISDTTVANTVMNGLGTEGKWYEFSFDYKNIDRHLVMAGIQTASSAAGSLVNDPSTSKALSTFVQGSLMTLYDYSRGNSLQDSYLSNMNWNGMMVNMSDLGNQMGQMMRAGMQNDKAKHENEQAGKETSNANHDPFGMADTMLGGILLSLGGALGQTQRQITDKIAGSALGSAVGELYSGSMLDTAVSGVSDGFNYARNTINSGINKVKNWGNNAWKGVKDFAVDTYERAGNWISGVGFKTNKEIAVEAALLEYERQLQKEKDIAMTKALWESGVMDNYLLNNKYSNNIVKLKELGYSDGEIEQSQIDNQNVMLTGGYDKNARHPNNNELDGIIARQGASAKWSNQFPNASDFPSAFGASIQILNYHMDEATKNSEPIKFEKAQQQILTHIIINSFAKHYLDGRDDVSPKDIYEDVIDTQLPRVIGPAIGTNPKLKVDNILLNFNGGNLWHVESLIQSFYNGSESLEKYYKESSGYWFDWVQDIIGVENKKLRDDDYSSITKKQYEILKKIQEIHLDNID